jgi:hypothetical protein
MKYGPEPYIFILTRLCPMPRASRKRAAPTPAAESLAEELATLLNDQKTPAAARALLVSGLLRLGESAHGRPGREVRRLYPALARIEARLKGVKG